MEISEKEKDAIDKVTDLAVRVDAGEKLPFGEITSLDKYRDIIPSLKKFDHPFRLILQYVSYKDAARAYRLEGMVAVAQRLESQAEGFYKKLPEEYKW